MAKKSEGIYSGAADFGRFMVSVSALVAIIVAVIMAVVGVFLLFQRNVHSATTTGTIASVNCKPLVAGLNRCELLVNYLVNGEMQQLQQELETSENLVQGGQLDVFYDPDRPEDAVVSTLTPRQMALRLLIGAGVLFLIAVVSVWLTRRYKFLAATAGVGEAVGLVF